jgi:transcriptional regulator with XRE-family HTH domain
MIRNEKILALDGIDPNVLTGSNKNKEIVKLFMQGMTYKEIAKLYGLSASRINQILDTQARRANFYKSLLNDLEYHELVEFYKEKMHHGENIIIESENKPKHIMAVIEARTTICNDMIND